MKKIYILSILILIILITISWTALAQNPAIAWRPYLSQMTPTGVIIQWTTDSGTGPEIRYSTGLTFDQIATGDSRTLTDLNTQLHRVPLGGLTPNTTYFYKPLVGGIELLPGQYFSFTTAPLPGDPGPITFIAFGDFGTGNANQARLRDRMAFDIFDLILTTGDNAYPDATYLQFDQTVFQVYQTIFPKAPLYPSLGNHDYHTESGAPYLNLFDLPPNAWRPGDQERYYSFDYGPVHFIALDTQDPFDVDDAAGTDDMFDWLRADLAATTRPWIVVFFHDAVYTSGTIHGPSLRAQSILVPIFETHAVNLVLNGHEHIYQRTHPLLAGGVSTIEAGGIIYIVTGAGNIANYPCGADALIATSYCAQDLSIYSRVTVDQSTMLIEAIDHNGLTRDTYTINRSAITPTPTPIPAATETPQPAATLQAQINQNSDDAEESMATGKVNLYSSDLELIRDVDDQVVGLRFSNLNIPPGATILMATITFEADSSTPTEATSLTFRATYNPATFPACGNQCNALSSLPTTQAATFWPDLPQWIAGQPYTTPNLSPIIQEIIDGAQGQWSPGDALGFVITGSGRRRAKTYDGNPDSGAILWLSYTTATTPTPTLTPIPLPTDTPTPTPTQTPTPADTPPPTDTPTPIPTDTPLPTDTAIPTPTQTNTPPPTTTNTPQPTPTIPPSNNFHLTIYKNGSIIHEDTCALYQTTIQNNTITITCQQ